MKKLFAAALFVLAAGLVPAAAQTGNVSVGPIYSFNFLGFNSPLGGPGITGKIPGLAPIWGLAFSLTPKESSYFLGVTADWQLYKQPLYEPFNINFYMGPGFYLSALAAKNGRADLGLRIPIGVNWTPVKFIEVFTELTPAYGITFQDTIQPAWLFQAGVGARVWF
jgi:hypothetical protein